jgi:hypothetical protein
MTMNKLAAIMFTWFGGQVVCYVLDGLMLGGPTGMLNGMMQSAMGFNISSTNGFNLIMLPLAFINFLAKVLFWNFAFLSGDFFIVKVLLTVVITIPALYGLWQGLRGS